jgi:hypothetical protein
MRVISRGRVTLLGAVALALLGPRATGAVDVTELLGRMQRAAEPGRDMRAGFAFVITNARGERVHWTGQYYRTSRPAPRKRLAFDAPVDLRGVSVSVRRTEEERDRIRVYLPFVRRVRELDADMRGESFLGTDFNFEDLGFEQLDYARHALLGQDEVDGRACRILESVPDRSWWYGRIVRCIDEKDHLPRRTDYYDPAGVLYKRRTFDRVVTIAGHPTPVEVTMEVIPARTSTRLVLRDVEYDTGLRDELFAEP